ncbi:MAG: hypothetical protein K2J76_01550 [Oscillospiraceae bacterium]|nr:hypothetical protein [Oscillospiraceae bacterium]
MDMNIYNVFSSWLDNAMSGGIPEESAAAYFCLYEEHGEHLWAVQFICTECFDPDDDDWACCGIFTTGEDLFRWDTDMEWQDAQVTAEKLVEKYLSEGKYSETLKALHGVGVGFADGDITVLYRNENSNAPKKDMLVLKRSSRF